MPANDATSTRGVAPFFVDEKATNDYYPYGMLISDRSFNSGSSRYGYNGKEMDKEINAEGNWQDYGMRAYDTRIARFPSVDPLTSGYPMLTPYQYASNTPIQAIDLDGLEAFFFHGTWSDPSTFEQSSIKTIQNTLGNTSHFEFKWNGNNTQESREQAAKEFVKFIKANRDKNQPLNIVGHSHGGNGAILATNEQNKTNDKVLNLVTINTPVTSENQLKENSPTNHVNLYNYFDIVQTIGGAPNLNLIPSVNLKFDINLNPFYNNFGSVDLKIDIEFDGSQRGTGEIGLGSRTFVGAKNFGYFGWKHDLHNKPMSFLDDLKTSITTKKNNEPKKP
ncbi:MAG: DUF2974 domain-containing protein [Candidatus Kapabacteria bacterium]|nr:DUF2974 domain-containing protein [Candidatus Kapabacteria bacterium]